MTMILVGLAITAFINPQLHDFSDTMENFSEESENPAPSSIFDNLHRATTLVPIIIVVLFVIVFVVKALNQEHEYQVFSKATGGV